MINNGIANGPHGSTHIYMDNIYYDPQLFAMI